MTMRYGQFFTDARTVVLWAVRPRHPAAWMVCALFYAPAPVWAQQSHCVVCTEPSVTYACAVADETGAPTPTSLATQITCLQGLAKAGGHASCKVNRKDQGACQGQPVLLPAAAAGASSLEGLEAAGQAPGGVDEGLPDQAIGTLQSDRALSQDGTLEPIPDEEEAPPKNLVEATSRAVKQSEEQLRKAGEAVSKTTRKVGEVVSDTSDQVGEAAKSTWDCVVSLFKDCP